VLAEKGIVIFFIMQDCKEDLLYAVFEYMPQSINQIQNKIEQV
jgi:hypothetical protein